MSTRRMWITATILNLLVGSGIVQAEQTRDILIAHESKPIVFFGMYRASQMTQPGWLLYERSVDWANNFQNPADTKVWLATYNGTLDPNVPQEADSIAVYDRLTTKMGFLPQNIHVGHQSTIETGNFTGYDLVIYSHTYPRNATNVLNQNKPFVTMSAGETDELGIGTGTQVMHEYRDNAWVFDPYHHITDPLGPGQFFLAQGMWMDASTASGAGQILVNADFPEPATLSLLVVAGLFSRRR